MSAIPETLRTRALAPIAVGAAALCVTGFACAFIEPARALGVLLPIGLSALAILGYVAQGTARGATDQGRPPAQAD